MNLLADLAISLLLAFKQLDPIAQFGLVASPIVSIFIWYSVRWRLLAKREADFAVERLGLRRDLTICRDALGNIESRHDELVQYDAESTHQAISRELTDNNIDRAVKLANTYLEHHRPCFALTCKLVAEHHLARFEDGFDALLRARAAAMGAVAAGPNDRDALSILEEIEALQRVELQPPESQEAVRDVEEREKLRRTLQLAPSDLDALCTVSSREFDAGRYVTAAILCRRAAEVALECDDFDVYIHLLTMMARAFLFADRLDDARSTTTLLLQKCAALGQMHSLTMEAEHLCALLYEYENEYSKAEVAASRLLKKRTSKFGADHPDTLSTESLLGRAMLHQERYVEAESVFRKVLSAQVKVVGGSNSYTNETFLHLAIALMRQHQHAEAESILKELSQRTFSSVGSEHLISLGVSNCLGESYLCRGKAADAERLFAETRTRAVSQLGRDHRLTVV